MASGGGSTSFYYRPTDSSPTHMKRAYEDLGLLEWVEENGRKRSNPQVEEYIEVIHGKPLNAMTTPWCAFWLAAIQELSDQTSAKSGRARASLTWGSEVNSLKEAKEGDVIVLWRGTHDDGVSGHVGFYVGHDSRNVYLLGGNQGDTVSIQAFNKNKIIGIRRARPVSSSRTIRAAAAEAVNQTLVKPAVEHGIPDQLEQAKSSVQSVLPAIEALSDYKPVLKIILHTVSALLILAIIYFRWSDHKEGRT